MSKLWTGLVTIIGFTLISCGPPQNNDSAEYLPTRPANSENAKNEKAVTLVVQVQKRVQLEGCHWLVCSVSDATKCFIPEGLDEAAIPDGAILQIQGVVQSNPAPNTCMQDYLVVAQVAKAEDHPSSSLVR